MRALLTAAVLALLLPAGAAASGTRFLGLVAGDSQPSSSREPPRYGLVVADVDGRILFRLDPRYDAYGIGASWSPDATRLVLASPRGPEANEVVVVDPATGAIRPLTSDAVSGRVANASPLWSPTGEWIVWTRTLGDVGELWAMHPDGAGVHRVAVGERPLWSTDGSYLAYRRGDELRTVRADGSDDRFVTSVAPAAEWSPANAHRLLYATPQPEGAAAVHLRDAATGDEQLVATAASAGAGVRWSPDGARIAYARPTLPRTIGVVDVATRAVRIFEGDAQEALAWAPDGRSLVWGAQRTIEHPEPGGATGITWSTDVYRGDVATGVVRRLTGPFDEGIAAELASDLPMFAPGGERIVFARGGFFGPGWQMNGDGTCETALPQHVTLLSWAPDAAPVPPLRCADLSVRLTPPHGDALLDADAPFALTIENDGNEAASPHLILSASQGLPTVAAAECLAAETIVDCTLAPLQPGASRNVTVVDHTWKPGTLDLTVHAIGADGDDPANNTARTVERVLPCTLLGTPHADVIRIDQHGMPHVCALAGNDSVFGGAFDDTIDAGAGNDYVNPGGGNDVVLGGPGNDTIDVRDAAVFVDRVTCGPGRDTVRADPRDRVARDCERVLRRR